MSDIKTGFSNSRKSPNRSNHKLVTSKIRRRYTVLLEVFLNRIHPVTLIVPVSTCFRHI